jgi:hypothetical protein
MKCQKNKRVRTERIGEFREKCNIKSVLSRKEIDINLEKLKEFADLPKNL